jgi:A/G-specific adenine glycosylase
MDYHSLKTWFKLAKRDLPWRNTTDPYAIWVSEIMLQQTRVNVVIPYFSRWMKRFPTISTLAAASLDEVIKMWEGLGYYSRVRNLHTGAQYIMEHCNGKFPEEMSELKQVKGLGPYTIGAILSFAFHQKQAAVDGNVMRVIARYFGIEDDITKSATMQKFRNLVQELLPEEEPWVISEALIELGATHCQRKAVCSTCPLKNSCIAFAQEKVEKLPVKSKKIANEYLYRTVAVIQSAEKYLVKRGKTGEIMCDLYEFPYVNGPEKGFSIDEFQIKVQDCFSIRSTPLRYLQTVKHGFTRYSVTLYPILFSAIQETELSGFEWLPKETLLQLAFSSGHRKILQQL